jgi:ribosomal protein S18
LECEKYKSVLIKFTCRKKYSEVCISTSSHRIQLRQKNEGKNEHRNQRRRQNFGFVGKNSTSPIDFVVKKSTSLIDFVGKNSTSHIDFVVKKSTSLIDFVGKNSTLPIDFVVKKSTSLIDFVSKKSTSLEREVDEEQEII